MKKTLVGLSCVFAISYANPAVGHEITVDQYNFPISNPLLATVLSVANGMLIPYKKIEIEFRQDREKIPLLEGKNKIPLALFPQKNKSAPLVFVISGAGGDALGGASLYLATELQAMGYHAVTMPDPLCWPYVLGRSETALPGYLARDSKEYYQFLQEVAANLRDEQHLDISGYSVVGTSYGGLLAGFLEREDMQQGAFHFNHVVMINPAVDLGHGIDVLDSFYSEGDHMSQLRKDVIMGTFIGIVTNMLKNGFDLGLVKNVLHDAKIGDPEMKWAIGNSFRESLRDIVFASQQIDDLHILKTPATKYQMNRREGEAFAISFHQYMNEFVLPSVEAEDSHRGTKESYMYAGSLYSLIDLLKNDPRVYVMDNADDILLKTGDVDFFKSTLGDRFYLYPLGGHIGNIQAEANRRDFHEIMKIGGL